MDKTMKKEELKETRQYKSLNNNGNSLYVSVPLSWCARFDLSPVELLLFCHIRHRTENYHQRAYTGSIPGLAVVVNASVPTVRKALDNLIEKGFIRKTFKERQNSLGRSVSWIAYESMLDTKTTGREIEEELAKNRIRNIAIRKI
jgi:DNA-binding MarR family transcriptional regulator